MARKDFRWSHRFLDRFETFPIFIYSIRTLWSRSHDLFFMFYIYLYKFSVVNFRSARSNGVLLGKASANVERPLLISGVFQSLWTNISVKVFS